jgi:hypothetical protein
MTLCIVAAARGFERRLAIDTPGYKLMVFFHLAAAATWE